MSTFVPEVFKGRNLVLCSCSYEPASSWPRMCFRPAYRLEFED